MKIQRRIGYLSDHRKVQSQIGVQKRSSDQSTPTSSGSHNWVSFDDLSGQKCTTEHLGKHLSAASPSVEYSHLEINSGKYVPKAKLRMGLRPSETCNKLQCRAGIVVQEGKGWRSWLLTSYPESRKEDIHFKICSYTTVTSKACVVNSELYSTGC